MKKARGSGKRGETGGYEPCNNLRGGLQEHNEPKGRGTVVGGLPGLIKGNTIGPAER